MRTKHFSLFLHILTLYLQGHYQRWKGDCHAATWSVYIRLVDVPDTHSRI